MFGIDRNVCGVTVIRCGRPHNSVQLTSDSSSPFPKQFSVFYVADTALTMRLRFEGQIRCQAKKVMSFHNDFRESKMHILHT